MAKRKRGNQVEGAAPMPEVNGSPSKVAKTNGHPASKTSSPVIQIIAGSYERVLHGITASLSDFSSDPNTSPSVQFADSFLFNAHDSAIRCLALSPLPDPSSASAVSPQGVFLATGGSDEKVNVYSLATSPISDSADLPPIPPLGNIKITENPRNRELGSILEHSSNITALHFPTRSKLLSAGEDNTIAITRLKDLTVVSSVKAPWPKAVGQPSGDTAPQGITPAGVNDFAVASDVCVSGTW
jgi:protein MAK11